MAKTIATTNFKVNYQLSMDLMTLNNSFDHLNNRAAKCLPKDLYSALYDVTYGSKNIEDKNMTIMDCEMGKPAYSSTNRDTLNEIVKNLFTTSKVCDHIFEDKEGPPVPEKLDENSELDDLTVRTGINSESFK